MTLPVSIFLALQTLVVRQAELHGFFDRMPAAVIFDGFQHDRRTGKVHDADSEIMLIDLDAERVQLLRDDVQHDSPAADAGGKLIRFPDEVQPLQITDNPGHTGRAHPGELGKIGAGDKPAGADDLQKHLCIMKANIILILMFHSWRSLSPS